MKRLFAVILTFTMLASLCGCGQQAAQPMEPEHPNHTDEVTEIHYAWGERVNMTMLLPEGWQWQSDEHNGYNADAQCQDLPDTVGFDFWCMDDPEVRFSFQCWTQGFAMCGTGVDFAEVNGLHKMTVATEPSSDGTVYVHMILQGMPGDYVVRGEIPAQLWEKYRSAVVGMVDEAAVGEGCMEFEDALCAAQKIMSDGWNGEPFGRYDVLSGTWTVIFQQGSNCCYVDVDQNGRAVLQPQ